MEKKEIKTFVDRVNGNVSAEISALNKRVEELTAVKEKLEALIALCIDTSFDKTIDLGDDE